MGEREHTELGQQLETWFGAQDIWKTKKALAAHLGIGYTSLKATVLDGDNGLENLIGGSKGRLQF